MQMSRRLLRQEFSQAGAPKMVNDTCRDEDRGFSLHSKRVGHREAARQSLFVGERLRQLYERRVVVAAHQTHVTAEPAVGGEPAHHEAEATAHVDDPVRRPNSAASQRSEQWSQHPHHALTLPKFLGQARQLVVGREQHLVDVS
jgi:hypothetical protein